MAGRPILIDDATARGLNGALTLEPLGGVPFKGKAAAVEVFAVPACRAQVRRGTL